MRKQLILLPGIFLARFLMQVTDDFKPAHENSDNAYEVLRKMLNIGQTKSLVAR